MFPTRWSALVVFIALVFPNTTALGADLVAQGVSPGSADKVSATSSHCPSFSWEAVPGAAGYELVIYRIEDDGASPAEIDSHMTSQVLFTELPGRATSWTPSLADCLAAGERYVWFIRAVPDADTDEGSEWSEPRFFEVAAAPSAEELERAIEIIRRWEAAAGDGPLALSADAVSASASDPATATAAVTDSGTGSGSGSSHPKSVVTGTAAIRGVQPDASGETYGVVGTSASPDGAGIGAANTAGGPDLVLDGSVPAEFSEAGIDRQSASPQTFSFSNTGGGGLTLDIDGIDIITSATDQDTIGALTCGSGQLAKWNGATWVCAPDLDTDTLSGLSCATWQVPKWTGSAWECDSDWDSLYQLGCGADEIAKYNGSTWICAEDEDTASNLGPGLILDGDQIRIDPWAFSTRISTIDSSSAIVGQESSIATGADGFGLISYWDAQNHFLKVAHCDDVPCTTATTNVVDAVGAVGRYNSIAIGTDGLGLISYFDMSSANLKVAHCDDILCSSSTISTLDSGGSVGEHTSIAVGADGLGIISYYDQSNESLMVAHCVDIPCSAATLAVVDGGGVGKFTSIAIGGDDLALISYWDYSDFDLKVAHCDNLLCTSSTNLVVDSSMEVGRFSSLAIGPDGLGLISYRADPPLSRLKVAHCLDSVCSYSVRTSMPSSLDFGMDSSLVIDDSGLGIIVSWEEPHWDLWVTRCTDFDCANATFSILARGAGFNPSSITIGEDGRALVSYMDETDNDLKVAHLPIGF